MSLRFSTKDAARLGIRAASGRKKDKRPKYGNKSVSGYHSAKEAKRAQELKYEQHAGIITDLEEQPKYELIPKQKGERATTYTADFRYKRDGIEVVEDVKSEATRRTQQYVIKRKLMLQIYKIRILET